MSRLPFDPETEGTPGRIAVVNGLLALVILMVVFQLWLVTVALDVYLVGDPVGATLAVAISAVIFLLALSVSRIRFR